MHSNLKLWRLCSLDLYSLYIIAIVCRNEFSVALFWPNSRRDSLVTQSCSQLHPSFRSGVNIGRQCRSDGSWSPVDLRNCTMFKSSKPVSIVYFTVTENSNDVMSSKNNTDKVSDWSVFQVKGSTLSRNAKVILWVIQL